MAAIYSKRFAAGYVAPGAAFVVYTCPVGVTAVVVDIELSPQTAPATRASVTLNGGRVIFEVVGGVQYVTMQWRGRAVLNSGDQLYFVPTAGTWAYFVSGYELGV